MNTELRGDELLDALKLHLLQMAPYKMERPDGKLLKAAVAEIERLRSIIDEG